LVRHGDLRVNTKNTRGTSSCSSRCRYYSS
jgi:hypothetical protein